MVMMRRRKHVGAGFDVLLLEPRAVPHRVSKSES